MAIRIAPSKRKVNYRRGLEETVKGPSLIFIEETVKGPSLNGIRLSHKSAPPLRLRDLRKT